MGEGAGFGGAMERRGSRDDDGDGAESECGSSVGRRYDGASSGATSSCDVCGRADNEIGWRIAAVVCLGIVLGLEPSFGSP